MSRSSLSLPLLIPVLTLTAWSSPPVINPLSAPVIVDRDWGPSCGWGSGHKNGYTLPPNWAEGYLDPYVEGASTSAGSGPNISMDTQVDTGCQYIPFIGCTCGSLASLWRSPTGRSRATFVPLQNGEPVSRAAEFRVDVKGLLTIHGSMNRISDCSTSVVARVVALAQMKISSDLVGMAYTKEISTDAVLASNAMTVTASASVGTEGITGSVTAQWTIGGDIAVIQVSPVHVHEWGIWCGDPTGRHVQVDTEALSFGQCINGADMECHAEVSEVTIELEVLRCVCHAPSGPTGPTRLSAAEHLFSLH